MRGITLPGSVKRPPAVEPASRNAAIPPMRTKPTRWKRRRRTLAQEFRDSFRAGPRAWGLAALVLGCVASSWTAPLLLSGALLLFLLLLLPAMVGAALGKLVAVARDVRLRRRLQRTPPGLRRLRRTPGTAP